MSPTTADSSSPAVKSPVTYTVLEVKTPATCVKLLVLGFDPEVSTKSAEPTRISPGSAT